MSIFIFIDESGDPGNVLQDGASSSYYSELALQINKDDFKCLTEHVINWLYINGMYNEIKTLPKNPKSLKRYVDPLINLCDNSTLCCSCVYLIKENYQGPYFRAEKYNAIKFRNFVHRKLLEYHFQCFPPDGSVIELVFDRYRMSNQEKDNLETYLRNNYNLPSFGDISHVDSMISGVMQLTSQLVSATKDIILMDADDNKKNLLNFIKFKDITKLYETPV
jgi:hypothetical protein